MNIQDTYRLASVFRWHIVAVGKPQSVAEHSYFVTLLVDALFPHTRMDEIDYNFAIRYALIHDAVEAYVGDIPSPVKQAMRPDALHELETQCLGTSMAGALDVGQEIKDLVKLCDRLEAVKFLTKYATSDHAFNVMRRLSHDLDQYMVRLQNEYADWNWPEIKNIVQAFLAGPEETIDDVLAREQGRASTDGCVD